MRLYVTPLGRWRGTQAEIAKATRDEGSKPGSWREVDVPTTKEPLLRFLNHGWREPGEPERAAPPVPKSAGSGRYRVYFKGTFAGVLLADSLGDAQERAPDHLTVRLDLSRR